jgi:hypothetical protein
MGCALGLWSWVLLGALSLNASRAGAEKNADAFESAGELTAHQHFARRQIAALTDLANLPFIDIDAGLNQTSAGL